LIGLNSVSFSLLPERYLSSVVRYTENLTTNVYSPIQILANNCFVWFMEKTAVKFGITKKLNVMSVTNGKNNEKPTQ